MDELLQKLTVKECVMLLALLCTDAEFVEETADDFQVELPVLKAKLRQAAGK